MAFEPVNPQASPEARRLLEFIYSLYGKRTLSGQHNYPGFRSEFSDRAHEISGRRPAIWGQDFGFTAEGKDSILHRAPNIKETLRQYREGSIITWMWHAVRPMDDEPNGWKESVQNHLTDAQWKDLITPGTKLHQRWLGQLEVVAGFLTQLRDAHVPVLWRPYHEMNGDWFWWGGQDPKTFVQLWRQMFDYFTQVKGLDNLLWVYGPNHGAKTADYYPGERYVDLVGLDAYTDFIDPEHIKGYPEVARLGKPFGLSEFGPHGASNPPGDYDYRRLISGIQTNFPKTVFFMSWNANWSLARNTNVTEFLSHPWIANREDIPKSATSAP